MARIAIFGAGYVGLVTGACFADLGHEVVIRDVLPERIERLRNGEVPIYEPGLDDVLARNGERIAFTLDVREAVRGGRLPVRGGRHAATYAGDADLSAVWTVVDELPDDARATIVMKSTVPVGTGEKVRAALDARGLAAVGYVSNPEFTAEGTAVRDFMEPDRVVIGAFDDADGDAVEALHAGIDAPVVRADVNSAEMIKLAANAFLVTRISFINEIANVCELVGADVTSVAEGIGLDHRLGPHFLRAGNRLGRLVLPEGLARAEAARRELRLPLPPHERRDRGQRAAKAARRAEAAAAPRRAAGEARGAARPRFQAEHGRHARGAVARARVEADRGGSGGAWLGSDRAAGSPGRRAVRSPLEAVTGADAAVIVTEWQELLEFPSEEARQAMRHPLIVDGRNLFDADAVRALGFAYEGVGRTVSPLDVFPETTERDPETSE